MNVAIWQPQTEREVSEMKHTAGLYGAGVIEVWDCAQLHGLIARHGGLVVIEQDTHAVPLSNFHHPEDGLYLVGPMNGSIPLSIRDLGRIVQVETESRFPLKPSVAGAIVLHDRYTQKVSA